MKDSILKIWTMIKIYFVHSMFLWMTYFIIPKNSLNLTIKEGSQDFVWRIPLSLAHKSVFFFSPTRPTPTIIHYVQRSQISFLKTKKKNHLWNWIPYPRHYRLQWLFQNIALSQKNVKNICELNFFAGALLNEKGHGYGT